MYKRLVNHVVRSYELYSDQRDDVPRWDPRDRCVRGASNMHKAGRRRALREAVGCKDGEARDRCPEG